MYKGNQWGINVPALPQSPEGPRIMPARIYPTIAGCLNLINSRPQSNATEKTIAIAVKFGSTCNFNFLYIQKNNEWPKPFNNRSQF